MNITINANEINEAITSYVSELGIDTTGKNIEVHMVAGRGSNGFSANIEITKANTQPEVNVPTPRSVEPVEEEVAEEVIEATDKEESEVETSALFS